MQIYNVCNNKMGYKKEVMVMYEKSKEFVNSFNGIFDINSSTREKAIAEYPHTKSFTEFIIKEINKIIESQGLHPQNEYFRIDSMGYKSRWQELDEKKGFNPHLWDLEIAVEHENDSKDWLDEVIKLAHVCCPLRVVIGYVPMNQRDRDQGLLGYASEALKKLNCRNNILSGEFMVILGNCDTKKKVENYFNYKAYVLDTQEIQFKELK